MSNISNVWKRKLLGRNTALRSSQSHVRRDGAIITAGADPTLFLLKCDVTTKADALGGVNVSMFHRSYCGGGGACYLGRGTR